MILAAVDDLIFASKIRAAAKAAGRGVTFARSSDQVLAEVESAKPELVIFDLDREPLDPLGAIRRIRSGDARSPRLVAFARHTSVERIAAARAAGIDLVLARSAFFPALGDMLAGTTTPPTHRP
jgi:CheY-like chemotaxis protein